MKALHMVTFILLVVGGLNWLLVGAFSFDLVAALLGAGSLWSKIVYILVGLSAVWTIVTHKKSCKDCTATPAAPAQTM